MTKTNRALPVGFNAI